MRYFVAGNIWLFISLVIAVGPRVERSAPTRVSLWGIGGWFSPPEYTALWVIALLAGIVFLFMGFKDKKKQSC